MIDQILGLTIHPVHNVAQCEEMLNIGSKNRMIGATLMNEVSSRSHSIFTISIEQISQDNETIKKGTKFVKTRTERALIQYNCR